MQITKLIFDGFLLRAAAPVLALASLGGSASAANLVLNGDFEQVGEPGVSSQFGSLFPQGTQTVADWTSSGFNFVFTPQQPADTVGGVGQLGNFQLWGPGNGSSNGLGLSPAGGNYVSMDGDPLGPPPGLNGPISQTINGLIPGEEAVLTFFWAGAQQFTKTGANTEQFQVTLGSQTQLTPVLMNDSEGFTGWHLATMTFTPTSSTEMLSFLAIGMPQGFGLPPIGLLDGVTLNSVPEPGTWTLLAFSLILIGAFALMRRRRSGAAAGPGQRVV